MICKCKKVVIHLFIVWVLIFSILLSNVTTDFSVSAGKRCQPGDEAVQGTTRASIVGVSPL